MKKTWIVFVALILLGACKSDDTPDVSGISVNLETKRFERDFFAIDTMNMVPSLEKLQAKYPRFMQDFLVNILGLPPVTDTSKLTFEAIRKFLHDYRPVMDSASKLYDDISQTEKEIIAGLKLVKYYFPSYPLPKQFITFIGPMDAYFEAAVNGYGDVITSEGLAAGLQLHLGSNASFYHSEMGMALYPTYISRRFAPEYISVNCMKNIVDDLYPERKSGMALIDVMVEKGKRLYMLDKFLPNTPDTLKIGYTASQLEGCYKNEGRIWNFFLVNNLLLTTEPAMMKSYTADGPNTQELGEGSPGYIGLFVGKQIVKKYMEKNPSITIENLLQTNPRKIYEESKYRPK